MGSPAYPTKAQIGELITASLLIPYPLTYTTINSDTLQFEIDIPAQAVAVVTLTATT